MNIQNLSPRATHVPHPIPKIALFVPPCATFLPARRHRHTGNLSVTYLPTKWVDWIGLDPTQKVSPPRALCGANNNYQITMMVK